MDETRKHPLDFDALAAGSIVSMAELEDALLMRRDDDTAKFDFAAFKLAAEITRRLRSEGRPDQQNLKAVHRSQRGIFVLHAHEHKDYSARKIRSGLRSIVTGAAELHRVDRLALTDSEQRDLDREIARADFLASALRKKARFQLPTPVGESCSER